MAVKKRKIPAQFQKVITVSEYEKLKGLEAKVRLAPFIEQFLSLLGTVLAYKPIEEWPKEAKAAFTAASREFPTLAAEYKEMNKLYSIR